MVLKRDKGSNKSKGLCKLSINEELTIFVIDELKQRLSEKIDEYDRFELNLSDVEEIDSAGIQLLLAFKNELNHQKKQLNVVSTSAAVKQLIESYSIENRFNSGDVA
ncbi:hypothetical protein MNBD_GAMMA10-896 [hydrothermal vent metagenome]|uniref:STAS domain-containing protein n=1 Tax=hydrothermal vent metagenome TaxID=652676 RepID=A0A3B0YHD7_9ZZZZ